MRKEYLYFVPIPIAKCAHNKVLRSFQQRPSSVRHSSSEGMRLHMLRQLMLKDKGEAGNIAQFSNIDQPVLGEDGKSNSFGEMMRRTGWEIQRVGGPSFKENQWVQQG